MTTADAPPPPPPRPRRPADRVPSGVKTPRPPGRPRDPRCDEAILDAALHELATVGFTKLSMEAVATGAGVGKGTVYRRWPTKDALIVDALDTLADSVDAVETGSLRDDLVAWLNALRRHNIQSLSGRILPKLAAERSAHPELFATYSQKVVEPFRQRAADLLRRGIDSGELAADVDVDLVVDMLVGPVAYRQYMSGNREVSGARIGKIVDTVLGGIRCRDRDRDGGLPETGAGPAAAPGADESDGGLPGPALPSGPASAGPADAAPPAGPAARPGAAGGSDSGVYAVGGPYSVAGPYSVGGPVSVGGTRGRSGGVPVSGRARRSGPV